jgi:hypothetical protein
VYCPECNIELPDSASECFGCGHELTEPVAQGWVMIGTIEDKLYADFANETLRSSQIPAVIMSRSGFFGQVGLPLHPFYHSQAPLFEVSVPAIFREEAVEILHMVVGTKWKERKE